jgi:hypothetical protein
VAVALRRPVHERRQRLDPVRWPGTVRRAALARAGVVTALLTAAAGVLYAGEATPTCGPPASPPPGAGPSGAPDSAPPSGPDLPAGTVGVAVSLAEPAALNVLRAGDRVDLLAVTPPDTSVVAANALVLATPDPAGGLYLALEPGQARRVVALPPQARLAVLVRR